VKTPLIVGSQKLYLTLPMAVKLAKDLRREVESRCLPFDLVVCPSFINLAHVGEALQNSDVSVGAQNVHQEDTGAFTGQISIQELIQRNVSYVIIGHSELRAQQGETNRLVRLKAEICLRHGVVPIVCVGDTREDQEAGRSLDVISHNLIEMFAPPFGEGAAERLVIAYEPIWAIKAGPDDKQTKPATPEIANEVHTVIRSVMADLHGQNKANSIRLIYGGSVDQTNARPLLLQENIDGLLVGSASARLDSFLRIIDFAGEALNLKPPASIESFDEARC